MDNIKQKTLDGIINNTASIGNTVDKIQKENATRDLNLSKIIANQSLLNSKLDLIIKHLNLNTN